MARGPSTVHALATWDDGTGSALYAGGRFTTAGGANAQRIAKWNGTTWSALGTGVSSGSTASQVYALTAWDDGTGSALYVGGRFKTAGGLTATNIAKWAGGSWSPLSGPSGNGAADVVNALTVWDDGTGSALYAGGWFRKAGGVTANRIAKWNGGAWSGVAGATGNGTDNVVEALTTWDDGTGAVLTVGGRFITAGGVNVNAVAQWDGAAWGPFSGAAGNGLNNYAYALATWESALYAGGAFSTAGGTASSGIGEYGCSVGPAPLSTQIAKASVTADVRSIGPLPNPNLGWLESWTAGGTRPQDLGWRTVPSAMEIKTTAGMDETTSAEVCIELAKGATAELSGAVKVLGGGRTDPSVSLELIVSDLAGCKAVSATHGAVTIAGGATAGAQPFAVAHPGEWASMLVRFVVSGGGSTAHTVRFDLPHSDGSIETDR